MDMEENKSKFSGKEPFALKYFSMLAKFRELRENKNTPIQVMDKVYKELIPLAVDFRFNFSINQWLDERLNISFYIH